MGGEGRGGSGEEREGREGAISVAEGTISVADAETELTRLLEQRRTERLARREEEELAARFGLGIPRTGIPRTSSFGRLGSVGSVGSVGSLASLRTRRKKLRLPPLILDWSVDHVIKWLKHVVCLPEYVAQFNQHKISGKKLVHLHELKLVSDLEITAAGHPSKISSYADKALASSLVFSELHFRQTFFQRFDRQNKTVSKLQRRETRRANAEKEGASVLMKHQALTSPRIWGTGLDASALGASVQPHFLLDSDGGVDVGMKAMLKAEEQHAGHSFDEVGCLCENNWVCRACFVWNRAETSYDTLVCTWCGAERPDDYHPPSWTLQGALGIDSLCPVNHLVKERKEKAGKGGKVEETPKPLALPAPRSSYPRLTKHPPIVSQRGTEDGRRLQVSPHILPPYTSPTLPTLPLM